MTRPSMWSWWALDLGDGITASVLCERIKDEFRERQRDADPAAVHAVFLLHTEGDLHCQVMAYFSPDCAALAHELGAVPSAAPARAGLELLAGATTCWATLFPGTTPQDAPDP